MALIKPFFADARGKIAGIVYSSGKGGAYIRQKVTPTNPQTVSQTLMREFLAEEAKAYAGTLTQLQRDGWKRLANGTPYKNIYGDTKKLSAIAMYVKVNSLLNLSGASPLLDAPQNLDCRGMSPIGVSVTSTVNRTFDLACGPALVQGESIMVYAAVSITQGKMFVKNLYRFCFVQSNTGGGAEAISVISPAELGPFTDGTRLWVRAYRINAENGGTSLAQEANTIIA